jgi:hypothetical protein
MHKEEIEYKIKHFIYKIICPIYIWSIGEKSLEETKDTNSLDSIFSKKDANKLFIKEKLQQWREYFEENMEASIELFFATALQEAYDLGAMEATNVCNLELKEAYKKGFIDGGIKKDV